MYSYLFPLCCVLYLRDVWYCLGLTLNCLQLPFHLHFDYAQFFPLRIQGRDWHRAGTCPEWKSFDMCQEFYFLSFRTYISFVDSKLLSRWQLIRASVQHPCLIQNTSHKYNDKLNSTGREPFTPVASDIWRLVFFRSLLLSGQKLDI